MTMENMSPKLDADDNYLQWSAVISGALAAAALSFILLTFGITIGLGVSSTSSTWRDTSVALALLSGIYLILQAIVSFGFGGYIAGRVRRPLAAGHADEMENRDGLHGIVVWALAVLLGAAFATVVGATTLSRSTPPSTNASSAEPVLSYELDRLYRAAHRPPNVNLTTERAEAGRILLTGSSHNGVSAEDRTYLIQQVAASTGLTATEAERRVDTVIANSKSALARSRHSTVILAFSVATALLLGSMAAWAAACVGGRHREGAALPEWMAQSNLLDRRGMMAR